MKLYKLIIILVGLTLCGYAQVESKDPAWVPYGQDKDKDKDKRPKVPEASTYGAMLVGAGGALVGYRRWRQNRRLTK